MINFLYRLFKAAIRSPYKSRKVFELERIIWPPEETASFASMSQMDSDYLEIKNQALEKFLDLCEWDDGVSVVMQDYGLSRNDLKKIYENLVKAGLGQYVNQHFMALSTIAYYEPLLFYVISEKSGRSLMEIAGCLLGYWEGSIKNGQLKKMVI